jgi:4-hydroxybenzoate polyprenyltransferase
MAAPGVPAPALLRCGRLIRVSHTLFALPWALAGLLLGSGGAPAPRTLLLVLLCMVGARSAAMAFNRWIDRGFDAANPRTAARPSVTGEVTGRWMAALVAGGGILFITSSFLLSPLCGWLSLPTLLLLLLYSLAKRVTWASHLVLGFALGLSPVGAWLAARGSFDSGVLVPVLLGLAVAAWTAGFDILYACQDLEVDRRLGLHSVPARFGMAGALRAARVLHLLVPVLLAWAGRRAGFSPVYSFAVLAIAALLLVEHVLVRGGDLRRIEQAFFHANVAIALVLLAAVGYETLSWA